ncbi:MAG TPA: TonB C-terminal domain-containing protein [Burkholderiaceae bacterium]|jgi:colicin import membrane protein|nr:TonB C-terminal domain-containing protein [Burkholderiaceae bacterium]
MAAVAMHALLVAGMWFAVQWRTSSEAPAVAELWAPLAPVEPPAPPPPPPAPPQPEAPKPDADIVQQQQVKPHAPEQESPPPLERRPIEKREPKKAEPKKVEPKPSKEQIEREERAGEERRQAEIARLTGQVTGSARAAAASSGVVSDAYAALIKACIRPHIVFAVPDNISDQVYAEFSVDVLPTGEQPTPHLTKPSGLPGWDDAAERAIIHCDPFPRDRDGTVPRSIVLRMRPAEAR